jgi:hypothetical protein
LAQEPGKEQGNGKGTVIAMYCMKPKSTRNWLIGLEWYTPTISKTQIDGWHAAGQVALTVQDLGNKHAIKMWKSGGFYVRVDDPSVDPLCGMKYC